MEQKLLSGGRLLDEKGHLTEAGYAFSLVKDYARADIKAGALRIKEWDYYLIYNGEYGVALTIDDNSYMGLISGSFLDLKEGREKTVSPMTLLPFGKTKLPPTSKTGDIEVQNKKVRASFKHTKEGRHLYMKIEQFENGLPFEADFLLTDEPQDSMVIATPFREKETALYYNQKIIGMRASGFFEYNGKRYEFSPADSFGLLDWGRGVWTYENTWYWGAGQGLIDGEVFGYNIGYGFGDTSAASENMLFYKGKAHKLDRITFNIPKTPDGKDDYMSKWSFTSSDGRFEAIFTPVLDRAAFTSLGVILSDQHQVFGYLDGTVMLDDGTKLELNHFLGMAEKVRNKW